MAGETDKAKGHVKEAAGDLSGDDEMEREGKLDRAAGSIKDKAESAKDKVGDMADKVRDKAK